MRRQTSLPADFVALSLVSENQRGLIALALVVLLAWLFRWPLLDLAWNFSASLGLQEPAAGLDLDPQTAGARRETITGLPREGPKVELRPSDPALLQRVGQLCDSLEVSAELADNHWPERNMLRLPAPYGCRHWFVISGEDHGFHLYRFRCACGHEIDLLPDMQSGYELVDPRPLVEYYRSQRCSRCRFGESDQAGAEDLADE